MKDIRRMFAGMSIGGFIAIMLLNSLGGANLGSWIVFAIAALLFLITHLIIVLKNKT